jgi:pimeloyl-ACP methyl ester carboxylesterase
MTDSNDTSLPLDDGEIHVRQEGPREAPALVLVHGTAASLRSWDLMVPLLTGAHRVIRIDLLGCGRSAAPEGAGYAVDDQARRVADALDRLGVGSAVLVGHSSGGVVATAVAERRPDLVTALMLINTGPAIGAYTAQEVRVSPAQWPQLSDDELRRIVGQAFSPGFAVPRAVLDEAREMNLQVLAATAVAVHTYLGERALPQRLAGLGKPLLVLFGEDDQRWRPSSAADYRVVPGSRIEMLPGVGHTPIVEDPAHAAASLLAFTADLVP